MSQVLRYKDLNDYDALRREPLLAVLCYASCVHGSQRLRQAAELDTHI